MIELANVSIRLGRGGGSFSLEGVNLRVDGEKVIILGPNGSGKTTLLRAISGLIPYSGSIKIDGMEVRSLRNFVGYSTNLPEAYQIGVTVEEVLYIYEELKDLDRGFFMDMLRALGLGEELLGRPFHALSAGQSVLVRTALALASRPKAFGLDEPFENVDAARRFVAARYIRQTGREGIVVTHEVDMLDAFKDFNAYFLLDGRLQGPVRVSDLLESSVVEGEREGALLVLSVMGRKVSLVKGEEGYRFSQLGSLNRIYGVVGA